MLRRAPSCRARVEDDLTGSMPFNDSESRKQPGENLKKEVDFKVRRLSARFSCQLIWMNCHATVFVECDGETLQVKC